MTTYYYICDGCGNVVTITAEPIPEGETWECDKCSGSALWEFTNKQHALDHAAHIQRGVASGLFRRT